MRTRFRSVAVGLSILSVCCLWRLAPLSGATGAIELGVTGRRNATPTIAADGRFVAVAWGGAQASGATDVFAAVSRDGGRAFGAPVRVNNIDGDARAERRAAAARRARAARRPRACHRRRVDDEGLERDDAAAVAVGRWRAVVFGGRPRARHGRTRESRVASDCRPTGRPRGRGLARSPRAGARPGDGRDAPRSQEPGTDGVRPGSDPGLTPPDGVAMAQKSKLFFASLDGAAAPRAVTGGVCYCCKTALVSDRRSGLRGLASCLSRKPSRHGVHDVA